MTTLAENFSLLVNDLAGSIESGVMAVFYIIASYFVGTLSPAIILGRAHGVDIRSKGSGNAGATNVLRTLGKKAAAITLVVDISKGALAVLLAKALVGQPFALLCGMAAICGHIWPAFHGFKGGKGVATGLGVLLAFDPRIGGGALLVAAALMLISRRVSVGALAAAAAFPVMVAFVCPIYLVPAALTAVIIWVKHRQNIARLLRGEEPKINLRRG